MLKEWSEYARLRDEEDWIQQEIADAKGVSRSVVANRLRYQDQLPETIKEFVSQGRIAEGHLRIIMGLFLKKHFTDWLTTEQLWINLANMAVEKTLSVSKLKTQTISNLTKKRQMSDVGKTADTEPKTDALRRSYRRF